MRIYVNVENVYALCVSSAMIKKDPHVTAKFRELRDRAGMTLSSLAKAMGYRNSSSIQRYENSEQYTKEFLSADITKKLATAVVGKGNPPISEREVWALAYPKSTIPNSGLVSSFDPEDDDPDTDTALGYARENWKPSIPGGLPELDVKLGAGNGQTGEVINIPVHGEVVSGHKVIAEWNFPEAFLREEVKASPGNAIVLEVVGDSMQPTYMPGDRVIIDLSQNAFSADTVYAISDGYSEPQIKRLQRIPFSNPAQVRIISDNPALETFTVDLSKLTIIGRICGHLARK